MKRFLVIAFLISSLDRQMSSLQQHFTLGSLEIDMIQLIPKKARVSSESVANSHLFYVAYKFVWSQICFRSSFEFAVPSNISNGSVMSGLSNYTFASSVQFFALTNFDVRFHFNLATFFFKFFSLGLIYIQDFTFNMDCCFCCCFSGVGSSAMYSVSGSSKRFSSLIFIHLCPLQKPCAILKQQKERLLILGIERKTCMEATVTLPQQQEAFIILSTERKLCKQAGKFLDAFTIFLLRT